MSLIIYAIFPDVWELEKFQIVTVIFRDARMNLKLGGRICAFTQCKKCRNFVILLIPKQYHLKCKNNISIVLYLGFADIILGAFNKIEIFIQDTGYRTCGVSPLNRHSKISIWK